MYDKFLAPEEEEEADETELDLIIERNGAMAQNTYGKDVTYLDASNKQSSTYESPNCQAFIAPSVGEEDLYALIRQNTASIARSDIDLRKILGSGSFGEVFFGLLSLPGQTKKQFEF